MSIRNLKTLIAAAEHETFTATADALHLTHAAVSQQMKALEEEWQVALFDRTRRSPTLTPVGHAVVAKARDIVAAYDGIVPSVMGDACFRGELTLGAVPTTLTGLVPFALARLRAAHADVHVRVVPGLTTELAAQVGRSALDAAIITRLPVKPRHHGWEEIAREPLELLASPTVASDDPVELLRTMPFIRFSRRAIVGAQIESWLQDRALDVRESMEIDNLDVIRSMVHANLGVSLAPRQCVTPPGALPLKRLALAPAPEPRVLGLLSRSDSVKGRVIDVLLAKMREVVAIGAFDPLTPVPMELAIEL